MTPSSWRAVQRADRQPVAAGGGGPFYQALTVPLTHLVNFIDARLRKGRTPAPADPLSPLNPATIQEMI